MVLATQRPVVKVVSGQIKANIPCRVAFKVVTKTDSMVIMDRVGAEVLQGKGDMLYMDGKDNTVTHRLQGANLETMEIRNLVVEVVKENGEGEVRETKPAKVKARRRPFIERVIRNAVSCFPGMGILLATEDKVDGYYEPFNPWENEEEWLRDGCPQST